MILFYCKFWLSYKILCHQLMFGFWWVFLIFGGFFRLLLGGGGGGGGGVGVCYGWNGQSIM